MSKLSPKSALKLLEEENIERRNSNDSDETQQFDFLFGSQLSEAETVTGVQSPYQVPTSSAKNKTITKLKKEEDVGSEATDDMPLSSLQQGGYHSSFSDEESEYDEPPVVDSQQTGVYTLPDDFNGYSPGLSNGKKTPPTNSDQKISPAILNPKMTPDQIPSSSAKFHICDETAQPAESNGYILSAEPVVLSTPQKKYDDTSVVNITMKTPSRIPFQRTITISTPVDPVKQGIRKLFDDERVEMENKIDKLSLEVSRVNMKIDAFEAMLRSSEKAIFDIKEEVKKFDTDNTKTLSKITSKLDQVEEENLKMINTLKGNVYEVLRQSHKQAKIHTKMAVEEAVKEDIMSFEKRVEKTEQECNKLMVAERIKFLSKKKEESVQLNEAEQRNMYGTYLRIEDLLLLIKSRGEEPLKGRIKQKDLFKQWEKIEREGIPAVWDVEGMWTETEEEELEMLLGDSADHSY